MFKSIKTKKDIENFLEETNSLHDGYIIGVQYFNNGISSVGDKYYFDCEKTKLILQILVTSICDTVIEIEFEDLVEWQIKERGMMDEMTDTAILFNAQNMIVWTNDTYINMEELKNASYVIAQSMKWRIVK